jgi:uncharacterized protein (TIGR02265 family)
MSEQTPEPVVFGTAIEAMRNALKDALTPALRAQLKDRGVDLDKVHPAYPMDTWTDIIRVVAAAVMPDVPEHERYVLLGRRFMRGFAETAVGLAARQLGRLIGVRRTLLRMGRNFKQASNYLETEITEVSANELRLRTFTNERFLARTRDRSTLVTDYRKGVLEEVLVLLDATGTVEIVDLKPERQDVTFRVTWS